MLMHLKRLWEGLSGNELKMSEMFANCDEVAYKPDFKCPLHYGSVLPAASLLFLRKGTWRG